MQPTKSKSTRYQPKGLYLCAGALAILSTICNFGEQFASDYFAQINDYLAGTSPIQWRSREQAVNEAKAKRKPILYVVLVKGDVYSMRLSGEGLHDAAAAALINKNYIPVKIVYNEARNYKTPKGDAKVLYDLGFNISNGSLITVPWQMTDMHCSDILSTANLAEMGVEDTTNLEKGSRWNYNQNYNSYHTRGQFGELYGPSSKSIFSGYTDRQQLIDYLQTANLWHQLPATKGKIAWLPEETLKKPLTDKPRLIALVENYGASSDGMRLDLFWRKSQYDLINQSFEPVLVEFRHGDKAYNEKFQYLKDKYGVTSLPALVVEGAKLKAPLVQFGNSGSSGTDDFLQSALTGKEKTSHNFERYPHGAHYRAHHH